MKKVIVWSAKGGVGKSTIACAVARALSKKVRVGLADLDLLNPNLGEMLGVRQHDLKLTAEKILPTEIDGMKVMTLEFLPKEDVARLWKEGTVKDFVKEMAEVARLWGEGTVADFAKEMVRRARPWEEGTVTDFVREMLEVVDWSGVDYLVIDCPPGTGDAPQALLKLLGKDDCAVVVTGPRPTEVTDAVRTLDALRYFETRIAGLVVNFSGVRCACGKVYDLGAPAGEVAKKLGLQLLAAVPLCVDGGERLESFIDAERFLAATKRRFSLLGGG